VTVINHPLSHLSRKTTALREHEWRKVTFDECLEYTGKWKALALSEFVDHMERDGDGTIGGCLGHMVFDALAAKALNPLIPLPGLNGSRVWDPCKH
jgi:hypothetical protein